MKTFRKTFVKSFIKKKLLGKTSAKETFRESFIKAQSAMGYLMTYGWAILIVAVVLVLGSLYILGVFNGSAIPSGIVAYVPITITNSQSSATPSPFQQMISITESNYANYIAYNGKIANFEFFTQSGQVLPAWIENNYSGTLIIWVKLPNSIPASSSLTIYLGFASKSTNLLSSSGTSGIGEAPQLSCPNPVNTIGCSTYAQYDDGASVFNVYQNFAGSSCPSGWSCQSGAKIDNGVTLNNANVTSTSEYYPQIFDAYIVSTFGNVKGEAIEYFTNSKNNAFNINQPYWLNGNIGSTVNGNITANTNGIPPAFTGPYIQSLGWNGSTLYWWADYTNEYTEGTSLSSSSPYYLQISAWPSGVPAVIQWVRTRAFPPNGVMPSVSFGGLSTA